MVIPRKADNHSYWTTAIKVPVRLDTGELHEMGYLPDWVPAIKHPDSGKAFLYQKIPGFREGVAACISLHKNMPYARVIGWDISINETGEPVIMEANGYHNDIKFSEALSGPCFAGLGWENLWRDRRSW